MYGSPQYQINTATLGLHAEYTLFETRLNRLPIRPVLGYSSRMHYSGDFGPGWRLNYAAKLCLDSNAGKAMLFKGSGQPATFSLEPSPPGPEGRRLLQLTGRPTPFMDYPDRFTFFDEAQGVWYAFSKYDGDSLPDLIFDLYGNSLALLYDANKHLVAMRDAAGREMRLAYNAASLCESLALPDGRVCRLEYDAQGYLDCLWNFADIPTLFAYENGMLTQIIHGKTPRKTAFSYDNQRQISAVTNPNGGVTRYEREGSRVRVTTPAGRGRVYTSENGKTTAIADAAGETKFLYQNGNRVAEVDKNGHRSEWEYDEAGRLISEPLSGGGRVRYVYDAGGHIVSETGPGGESFRYANNHQGDPERVDYPDGGSVSYAYNAGGMPVREERPGGRVLEMSYDQFGNLLSETDALGQIAAYRYDACGYECVGVTNGRGRETVIDYDELGRLSKVTHPDGTKQYFKYNCCALVEYTDGAGHCWHTERDAMAHATKLIDPAGGTSSVIFDPDGIPVATIDENGAKTTSLWDAAGVRTEVRDPSNGSVRYAFDPMGEIIAITDERGRVNRISRAPGGAVKQVTTADGRVEQWSYDRYGRVAANLKPSGARNMFEYDAMGRLQTLTAGRDRFSLTRDAAGDIVTCGTPLGAYTSAYDRRGRVTQNAAPDGTAFAYEYNNDNTLATVSYPGGRQAVYEYDACGRPAHVGFGEAGIDFAYDAVGQVILEKCANGVEASYSYDALGNMTAMRVQKDGEALCAACWQYDGAGNLLHEDLELALLSDGDTLPVTPLAAEHDADNQFSALDGANCAKDMDGNLSLAGDIRCQYNAAGKLVRLETPDGATEYAYGAAAKPAEIRRGADLEKRYYDFAGQMLYRSTGEDRQNFIWVGGLVTGAASGDRTLYYHRDRRGNIVLVTDETGHPVCAYAYRTFGAMRAKAERVGGNPFTFMGASGVTDEGRNFYLTGLRAYYARVGRFLQPDPLWFADNANRYVYAKNNPLRYVDPMGNIAVLTVVAVGMAGWTGYKLYLAGKDAWKAAKNGKEVIKHIEELKKGEEMRKNIPDKGVVGLMKQLDSINRDRNKHLAPALIETEEGARNAASAAIRTSAVLGTKCGK